MPRIPGSSFMFFCFVRVVYFGCTLSIQQSDEARLKTCSGEGDNPSAVQIDTTDLLSSVRRNETGHFGVYRWYLEDRARQDNQAFEMMKKSLRTPGQKLDRDLTLKKRETEETNGPDGEGTASSAELVEGMNISRARMEEYREFGVSDQLKRNFYKRQTESEEDDDAFPTTESTVEIANTSQTKARRRRRGWKKFRLRTSQIQNLLSLYSDLEQFMATYDSPDTSPTPHMTKYTRLRRINRSSDFALSTEPTTKKKYSFSSGKYPSRPVRRHILNLRLTNILSEFDDEKRAFLMSRAEEVKSVKASSCYMEVFSCFLKHCAYDHYHRNSIMQEEKALFARACSASWLDAKKIIRILKNCCGKRFKYRRY